MLSVRATTRLPVFTRSLASAAPKAAAAKKPAKKAPTPPKRPATAFALFVKQRFEHRPASVKPTEYMATVAQQWKTLSSAEKSRLEGLYSVDRAAFDAKHAKPTGARGAYVLFTKARFDQVQKQFGGQAPDVVKRIAAQWQTLSAAEKVAYQNMAIADKARYEKERAAYAASH